MPGEPEVHPLAQLAHQFEHPFPLGKDDHLRVVLAALVEQLFQLTELGAHPVFRVEDVIGVADHAHHRQMAHELVLLLLRERTALGDEGKPRHRAFVPIVFALLLRTQGNEMIPIGAVGQFGFHLGLAPTQHVGRNPLVEAIQVAITDRPPAVIQVVEFAVESEQRAEHGGIEEIHQRMQLVNPVLNRCAGENEGVTAAETFDGLGRLGAPVLDPLRFVKHHNIGPETGVDFERVGQHLLVIDDGEER